MVVHFEHFLVLPKPDFLQFYATLNDEGTPLEFSKGIKELLVDLTILPTNMFMPYFVSLKHPDGNFYSVVTMKGKRLPF